LEYIYACSFSWFVWFLYKIKVIVFFKAEQTKKVFARKEKEDRERKRNLFEKTEYCEMRRKHTHENKTKQTNKSKNN
jgi:hypothetical protein